MLAMEAAIRKGLKNVFFVSLDAANIDQRGGDEDLNAFIQRYDTIVESFSNNGLKYGLVVQRILQISIGLLLKKTAAAQGHLTVSDLDDQNIHYIALVYLLTQRSIRTTKLILGHGRIALVTNIKYDLCFSNLYDRTLDDVP